MLKPQGIERRASRVLFGFFFGATLVVAGAQLARGQWVDSFDPNADNRVTAVVVQPDGRILIGGHFITLSPNGGAAVTRNRIARLNPDGTLDLNFNPSANNAVLSIALQADGKIVAGGNFTSIGGQTRNRIARLNSDGTLDTAFNPNANNPVSCLAVQADGKIVAGGDFTSIGGQTRNRIARLDATTGAADSFDPNANSTVLTIALQADGKILAGGWFSTQQGPIPIGGETRNYIARLDPTTGLADSFDPNADFLVNALAVQADGRILVGGYFSVIGGQTRNGLVRLDPITGLADSFNPNPNSRVMAIAVQADGKILAGGQFLSIGGQPRNHIARLDAITGLADSLDPNPNADVFSIAAQANGDILAAGDFTIIGGNNRNRMARLTPHLGAGFCRTFRNTESTFIPQFGIASPYPSNISVSGVGGGITSLTVKLNSLQHFAPNEIDMLLVAPNGQNAIILSDVGGSTAVSGVTLTLDDAAAASLPAGSPLVSGTFKPTNVETFPVESFPGPAPPVEGGSALSVFNGANPNGTWKLYIVGDTGSVHTGSVGGGWELNISTSDCEGPTPTPTPTPGCGIFSNPATITIPATGSGGISAPYPSGIVIQGLGGGIAKVTVAINGITHPDANDIDVLLVGPDGRNAIIMSDVGTYDSVAGVNLVLDDAAAAALPADSLLTSGTFRPTNIQLCYDEIGPLDTFPAPAPSPSGASTFSIFNGTNPNGTWSLYVFDDNQNGGAGGSGSFSGGWTITISTDSCAGPTATPMPSPAPGAATHFSFEVLSNVFGWITFRLTALDELNNIATAYHGTVHFASFPPWSSLPPDSELTNGTATFNAGLIGPDTYTIIASDTNDSSITVTSECISAQKPPTPSPTPTPPPTPTPGPTGTPLPTPCGVTFAENFDGVTAPALPTGWTTAATGGLTWRTSTTNFVSAPNDAWAFQYSQDGENILETPLIAVPESGGILSFRNHFNLNFGGNGMVLEISVNGGAYDDIIAAGGVFLDGGYTLTIVCCFGNPLTGRMAWGGISGANADTYITTTIMLPATASGQNIRLKWRVGTAESFHFGEVRIDDIVLTPAGCPTPTPSPTATETPSPTRALDLATRLHVETGNNVGIGGFIITGSAPRQILLRGIGPSLGGFGVPNPLADPMLELHGPGTFVTITNNNWKESQEVEINATGIPPSNDLESAILVTLDPGAYTAILSGNNSGTGVGLVEVYDLSQGSNSKLANISTRAFVSTGNDIVIAGFILGGGTNSSPVVIRGLGPSLSNSGLSDVLADPTLELRDSNGVLIRANDNWRDDAFGGKAVFSTGLGPTHLQESAFVVTLAPGAYTALLSGVNDGTGIGLVEVYDLGALP